MIPTEEVAGPHQHRVVAVHEPLRITHLWIQARRAILNHDLTARGSETIAVPTIPADFHGSTRHWIPRSDRTQIPSARRELVITRHPTRQLEAHSIADDSARDGHLNGHLESGGLDANVVRNHRIRFGQRTLLGGGVWRTHLANPAVDYENPQRIAIPNVASGSSVLSARSALGGESVECSPRVLGPIHRHKQVVVVERRDDVDRNPAVGQRQGHRVQQPHRVER